MTSMPNFLFEPTHSSLISSYRRAQYLVACSTVPSTIDSPEVEDAQTDADIESPAGDLTQDRYGEVFEWDTPETEPQATVRASEDTLYGPMLAIRRTTPLDLVSSLPGSARTSRLPTEERTPLLRKSLSFSTPTHPRRDSAFQDRSTVKYTKYTSSNQRLHQVPPPLYRRPSASSTRSLKYNYGGQSTFGQTLFNSIAILLGIGMLSEPLAFAFAGWVGGILLIAFYGFTTCYTAKLLAHMILHDPWLRSYADIGRKAFGPKSTGLTSALFCLELFSVSVVLVTLYADSLHTIAPQYSSETYKIWALVVLIPTVFLPLSLLSYASALGIMSTILIIVVIFVDGFTKEVAPGSLWSPAETSLGVGKWSELGVAFGLFMAGFSGHAVIPSLARDMVDPTEFDTMINWAFIIATFLYAMIGCAGYLMFGRCVSDEVSVDLLNTPGYNPILNKIALWMLVISPLSKFALATRPLNLTLEIMLGLESNPPPALVENSLSDFGGSRDPKPLFKRFFMVVERIVFTLLSVGMSIFIPEFSSMMAFLGSFSAFMICVIGPIAAKVTLAGRCGVFDAALLVTAAVMATWGTVAAFWT